MTDIQLKKAIILLVWGVAGLFSDLSGQQANTMYFMKENPLQHTLNPAFQPEYRLYIGFPGLSSIDLSAGNNSLTFSDIYQGKVIDGKKQTISFLHPEAKNGVNHFLKVYRKNLHVYTNLETSILTFGLQKQKSYFTFDISTKEETQLIIPKAIPAVFFEGVKDTSGVTAFNLHNLTVSATIYTELALGYSYNLDKQWNFGGKLKFLFGHANLSSDFQDLTLEVSKEKWLLKGNSYLYGSSSELHFNAEEDGSLDEIRLDDNINYAQLIRPSGFGMSVDLGATYKLNEALQLSASVIDLGFIHWSRNLGKINKELDFEFDGIEYDMHNDSINYWKEYRDMLKNMYFVEKKPKGYTTALTAKIYIGAEYSILNDKIGFGLLSKTSILRKKVFEDITISTNFRPLSYFSASLSYSLLDGRWSNIGLGLNILAGPVHLFLIADNIPLIYAKGDGIRVPTKTKTANLSLGINFVFGKEKKSRQQTSQTETLVMLP